MEDWQKAEPHSDMKTALITGANGGLGFQCAKTILRHGGWNVMIAGRPGEKTDQAVESLRRDAPAGSEVRSLPVDFASLESVRELAAQFRALDAPPLDAIVCNAGIQSFRELKYSRDGFETTFAVNHLAHFLLVQLLLPQMQAGGRIVLVSSGTHDPDTLDGRFTPPLREG
jgi:NAD(P)-dependent dehydrogenase (short-subunit alcohol dehydrogenase family)